MRTTKITLLSLVLLAGLVACTDKNKGVQEESTVSTDAKQTAQSATTTQTAPTMKIFKATDDNVKLLGRTYEYNDALWLALSGSGVEFSFYGTKAEITLKGDQIASSSSNHARIGIYVNGARVIDDLLNESRKTYTVFNSDTEQNVTVRVVKLSEAAMSTVGIHEISVDAKEGITPTQTNVHKIEFIGDSITAGYGVDDENKDHHFSTATEDVTKTYAYKTALALQADYSIVAYSGFGIISGYTSNDHKADSQLVPNYYDKVGMSYGKFDGTLAAQSVSWDFNRFIPELIVINLGSNDDSYTKDDADKQAEYARQYVEFLKQIRGNNANATILCTLGIMGDRLFPLVEQAVADYTKETGDNKIGTMKFDVQSAVDGYAADWHPTEATQSKAAEKLIAKIKVFMNW
ncbi:MAG: SGNH/GDSL hydrolase family protein [Candidatus Cohnella colombiensis]|uniref:SGNH/GDSL hydrolase family protein n=1 Tax=Candidatus Cohnella colombiensis TaxID=3121368 RepID=A0AA95EU82_9BACL|nr:MAG: SGNH/GDSL hydrolase family protein [Cohnella sp.]